MDTDMKARLEDTARYIIETSTRETVSGNYIMGAEDIPPEILPPEMFRENIETIAKLMQGYESVAEADVTDDGEIDAVYYLAYCPNFEPDAEEFEDYPDGREILDPLTPIGGKAHESEKTQEHPKPTLAERLGDARRRAQGQPDYGDHIPKKRGLDNER